MDGDEPRLSRARRDELEAAICTQAGRIASATAEWLELIREFDAGGGWFGLGMASCAQWLSWRCGEGIRSAQEHVRVAHALEPLPLTRAAFATGRISYAKVRAITRVATPADEADLLEVAHAATGSQLERIVHDWRYVDRLAAGDSPRSYQRVSISGTNRGTERCVIELPPEQMAILRAAIEAATLAIRAEPEPGEVPVRDSRGRIRVERPAVPQPDAEMTRADAVVAIFQSWLQTQRLPEPGLGVGEVVVTVDVETFCGMTRETARETNAAVISATDTSSPSIPPPPGVQRPRKPTCRTVGARLFGSGAIDAATVQRMACEAAVTGWVIDGKGNPLDLGRRSRRLNRALRRALLLRDGGRCQAPGCTRRGYLHAHHVRQWQHGGETVLGNLLSLCSFHHHLVHEGGWTIAAPAPHVFVFYDPTGRPVAHGNPLPGAALPLDLDLPPNPLAATDSGPLHRDYVISVLLGRRDYRRRQVAAAAA